MNSNSYFILTSYIACIIDSYSLQYIFFNWLEIYPKVLPWSSFFGTNWPPIWVERRSLDTDLSYSIIVVILATLWDIRECSFIEPCLKERLPMLLKLLITASMWS